MNLLLFVYLFFAICLVIAIIIFIPNIKKNYDNENTGANILSFFFPIVGFIIYAVNVGKKNKIAKSCIRMAFLGMMSAVTIYLISMSIIVITTQVEITNTSTNVDKKTNISISDSEIENVKEVINSDDRVSTANVILHGKIINVIFNVNKDTSVEEAKEIAQSSLAEFSSEIKEYYDIQYMISNKEEVSENKKFPIMGYKNSKSSKIIW